MSKEEGFLPYEISDYHWKGLDPDVQQRFVNLAQEFFDLTGEKLRARSGFRSTEHQAKLYAADPNSGYVARPGGSTHEKGLAIDLDKGQVDMMPEGLIEKYFNRPLMGQTASGIVEKWHIEHPDARQDPIFNTRGKQAGGGGVLAKIGGAVSNALGPNAAEAAEGPADPFASILEAKGKGSGGGGADPFASILGEGGKEPGTGIGAIISGAKRGLLHSAGKFMAEASQGAGPAHGFEVSQETGNEQIRGMTPEYDLSKSSEVGKTLFALGEAGGALPEYMLRALPFGMAGAVPGFTTRLLAKAAGSALPFAEATALEPDATGREIGAAGGAGAALPFLHPLPWWARGAGGFGIGYGQAAAGSPESSALDRIRSGGLMALMAMLGGRQQFAPPTPKGAEVPPTTPFERPTTTISRPEPTAFRGKVSSYGPKETTYYGPDGKPITLNLDVTKNPKGYGELAERLAEVDRIAKERGTPPVPERPPLRGTPEVIQGTPSDIPVIEPSIIQTPGQANARPSPFIYSDRGKAMEYGKPPEIEVRQRLDLADLDRRIDMKFGAPPREAALIPQPTEPVPQAGLPMTSPEAAGGLPAVRPTQTPTPPPDVLTATPQPQPTAAPTVEPATRLPLYNDVMPSAEEWASRNKAAPAVSLEPLGPKDLAKIATRSKTFEEFNTAVGERPLPPELAQHGITLEKFFEKFKTPQKSVQAEKTVDLKGQAPIDDIAMADFVKGIINKDWGYLNNELRVAGGRFNTDTMLHNFNSLTLRGQVETALSGANFPNPKAARHAVTDLLKEYESNVWNKYKTELPSPNAPVAAAPVGGLIPPPDKPPTFVGEALAGDMRHEFHIIPDPETPNVFRLMRQDYRGDNLTNQFSMATGTPADISRFMQTSGDMRWKEAAKYGEGYKATSAPQVKMYSGGPDTSAAVKKVWDAVKPFALDYKARFMGRYPEGELGDWLMNARDISSIGESTRPPFWVGLDYPTFQPLNDASSGRIEMGQSFKNDLYREKKEFYTGKLSREQVDLLDRKMVEGDAIGGRADLTREQVKQAIMDHRAALQAEDPAVYESYMSARRGYDMAQDKVEAFLKDLGLPETEVNDLRNKLGYRPEYIPHVWDKGKYFIQVEDPVTGTKHRTHARTVTAGNKAAAEYRAQYGPEARITRGRTAKLPDDVFSTLNPESVIRVLDLALKRAESTGDPATIALVKQETIDFFKTRGAMERFTERQNVGGYRTAGMREISRQYDTGLAGFVAKLDSAPKYMEALRGIDSDKTPNLYSYGRKYVQDVLRNDSPFDQMFGTFRALMFHQFLGASLRAAGVNLTQNWVSFAPWMAKEGMSMPELKVAAGVKDVLGNWRGFRALLRGEDDVTFTGNIKPMEGEALKAIFKAGALEDYQTQEMIGNTYGKGYGILDGAAKASRHVFGTSESLNRVSAALTAFRFYYPKAEAEGMNQHQAFTKATEQASKAVMSSHYLMGKYNLPEFARGGKLGTAIRGTGYQFKGFTHNYLEMMAHLVREDKGAALRSMGTMAALAGPLSIPIVNEARHLYNWITGTDPLEDAFQNKDQDPLYTALKYGLPGFLEADLSGSIGAQVVRPDNPASMVVNTLTGPLGSMIIDSAPQAYELYSRGAGVRSLEPLAPVAVKNVLKAYREGAPKEWGGEGVTTTRGQAIMNEETGEPERLTTREAIQQGLGVRPTRTSNRAAQMENLLRRKQGRQESQDQWASQYVRALREGDESTMESILVKVDQYNEWAMDRGEPPIKLMDIVKDRLGMRQVPKSWRNFTNERQ